MQSLKTIKLCVPINPFVYIELFLTQDLNSSINTCLFWYTLSQMSLW